MHDFQKVLNKQMLYLDDLMMETINRYQGELSRFWNEAVESLRQGEDSRKRVQERLDFEIPAYLERLRRDTNAFLDPNYKSTWIHPQLMLAERVRRGYDPLTGEPRKVPSVKPEAPA